MCVSVCVCLFVCLFVIRFVFRYMSYPNTFHSLLGSSSLTGPKGISQHACASCRDGRDVTLDGSHPGHCELDACSSCGSQCTRASVQALEQEGGTCLWDASFSVPWLYTAACRDVSYCELYMLSNLDQYFLAAAFGRRDSQRGAGTPSGACAA